MFVRVFFMVVALGFITLLPVRISGQETKKSSLTRETPPQKGESRPHKVSGPAVQDGRQTLEESKCVAGFKACRENLPEFKEADQFMQLKAAVFADLNRLEKPRRTNPESLAVRDADLYYQSTGNGSVNGANGRSIRESPAQAKSAILPVSLMSAGSSKP